MTKSSARSERALQLNISPDEITGLVREMVERYDRSGQRDVHTSSVILAERYKGKRNALDRMFCITTRMQCLVDLIRSDDPRLKGYTKSTNDPSCTVAHSAVFHATALCPVRLSGEHTWFDPDEFFDIALRQAVPDGNA